jgi:hypothetical protein
MKADLGANGDAAAAAAGLVALTAAFLTKNFRLGLAGAALTGWFGTLWWQRLLSYYYPASANP